MARVKCVKPWASAAVALPRCRSRVEIRVYMQKVKHLEYEHQNNIKSIANEGEELLEGEIDLHG